VHRSPDIYEIDDFFDAKTCEGFMTAGPRGVQQGTAKEVKSNFLFDRKFLFAHCVGRYYFICTGNYIFCLHFIGN
jgi:hypothetical protein